MKRLYNEYLAAPDHEVNGASKFIREVVAKATDEMISFALAHDWDLRDMESLAHSSMACDFAEAIIRRAMSMRRSEKKHEAAS